MKLREMLEGLNLWTVTETEPESMIPEIEKWLGMKLGPQLREFILEYSYLATHGTPVQFVGIGKDERENSIMVITTRRLRQSYDGMENFVFLENEAIEYVDAIVDHEDNVFWIDKAEYSIIDAEMKLFDYLYLRLKYGDWVFMSDEERAEVEMSEEDRLRYADA